ncbi:MAG TPA: hypothetical protein VFY45_22915 [Baekduia sp.]|nr:hypothetical protein [Baekduia sp.]
MHRQRLVLNGPAVAIARLADDLCAAGAVAVAGPTAGPPRLVWETAQPGTLERLCARHRDVTVGVERFELLGDELERLVVQGREATVLERQMPAGEAHELDGVGGVCLEEDGAPLDPGALRAAARYVLVASADLGPGPTCSAIDDAVRVGSAVGRLCATVAQDGPGLGGDAVIAGLAATASTLGTAGSACEAERRFERDWRLTQAIARAGRERLWARPGEAEWPEWLMDLLTGAAGVIEGCSACLHQPPAPFVSLHTEHFETEVEQLEHAAGRLVTTALQTLVLFCEKPSR